MVPFWELCTKQSRHKMTRSLLRDLENLPELRIRLTNAKRRRNGSRQNSTQRETEYMFATHMKHLAKEKLWAEFSADGQQRGARIASWAFDCVLGARQSSPLPLGLARQAFSTRTPCAPQLA